MTKQLNLVLGLEIHLHVKTATKMFCGCSSDFYGKEPNTHTCPTCLGLPGALPVPNFDAIQKTQILGIALNCEINKNSKFDRKHYFYPDLSKGYQISQYKQPLCGEGYLMLDSGNKAEIERIHLEEDTAKSIHQGSKTLIDFNKSGMALIEIVTKPTFKTIDDAVDFCKKIQEIVRTTDVGDVDMEKGQMRLEANISLRTPEMEAENKLPDYKVEVKNINSFRFMERAVKAEIVRQSALLQAGEKIKQENRGYSEAKDCTVPQRDKEEAHDYRYFSEPDIPPMVFTQQHIDELHKRIPELPHQRQTRYESMGLSPLAAATLSSITMTDLATKFETLVTKGEDAKTVAALLINKPEWREFSIEQFCARLAESKNKTTDQGELEIVVKKIIDANPAAVADFKKGKASSVEFLLGQIMRETKGKADARVTRELIVKNLG